MEDFDFEIEDKPILFGPRTGKSLKKLYKEIDENPTFKPVPPQDLLWAWYIGIPNSPISETLPDTTRWRMASARCFPDNKEKRDKFNDNRCEDIVKAAVEEFKKFSPEARLIAQNTIQTMIFNLQQLVNASMDDFHTYKAVKDENSGETRHVKEIDWTGRNAYVNSCAKISEVLPGLLKKIEDGGYGITDKKNTEDRVVGTKPIDLYHKDKKS